MHSRLSNYKGLIILDDISTELTPKYFSGMKKFWDSIPEKKWDITLVGHGSGTGLVSFGVDIEVLLWIIVYLQSKLEITRTGIYV